MSTFSTASTTAMGCFQSKESAEEPNAHIKAENIRNEQVTSTVAAATAAAATATKAVPPPRPKIEITPLDEAKLSLRNTRDTLESTVLISEQLLENDGKVSTK